MPAIPQHVAIIMDGNGRWAKQRGLPRADGHRAGADSLRRTLGACRELGIRYVTVYAFSTENWKRSADEVSALMGLLVEFLGAFKDELVQERTRLRIIGQADRLPLPARKAIDNVVKATQQGDYTLILALSYGGRDEIVAAARRLAEQVQAGTLAPAEITEERFGSQLFTGLQGIPDPDLVIRTAGEMRLSNFLLWQAAYAEFWATSVLWPDFSRQELLEALEAFGRRERRFGARPESL